MEALISQLSLFFVSFSVNNRVTLIQLHLFTISLIKPI